jgi:hypothetical protein
MSYISRITYRRVKNLGNYESIALEETIEIPPYEDRLTARDLLIESVDAKLQVPTILCPRNGYPEDEDDEDEDEDEDEDDEPLPIPF